MRRARFRRTRGAREKNRPSLARIRVSIETRKAQSRDPLPAPRIPCISRSHLAIAFPRRSPNRRNDAREKEAMERGGGGRGTFAPQDGREDFSAVVRPRVLSSSRRITEPSFLPHRRPDYRTRIPATRNLSLERAADIFRGRLNAVECPSSQKRKRFPANALCKLQRSRDKLQLTLRDSPG